MGFDFFLNILSYAVFSRIPEKGSLSAGRNKRSYWKQQTNNISIWYSTCNVNLYMINDKIEYTHDCIGFMINAKPDKRASRYTKNGFSHKRKT